MTFFSNFGYNKIFPLKCKTVTLNHFCSFRNIHWSALKKRWRMLILGLKVTHFPHLGHNNSHFYPLFNGCHHVQFQKNLINRFWQNFKNINLGPVIGPFTIYIYIYTYKISLPVFGFLWFSPIQFKSLPWETVGFLNNRNFEMIKDESVCSFSPNSFWFSRISF